MISFPSVEIGENFAEIFDETIRINTLDINKYSKIQQSMIDALDQGERVHVVGKGENHTDLTLHWQNSMTRQKKPYLKTVWQMSIFR